MIEKAMWGGYGERSPYANKGLVKAPKAASAGSWGGTQAEN